MGSAVEYRTLASVYLLNRSAHTGLGCTPYEMWYNRKPHVGHIPVWRCRAYAAIPKERRKKFDYKINECILVGFYDTENLYQLWDISAGETIKRCDVIFYEHVMGHPDLGWKPLPVTSDFPGNPYSDSEVEDEHSEHLEDLYPLIAEIKAELKTDEWSDIPASYLTLQEVLVDHVVPKTYKEAMGSEQANVWMMVCKVEHEALIRNNI